MSQSIEKRYKEDIDKAGTLTDLYNVIDLFYLMEDPLDYYYRKREGAFIAMVGLKAESLDGGKYAAFNQGCITGYVHCKENQ